MKTTTQIKDQLVRRGASEIIESLLANQVFFDTEKELREWADEIFDTNVLGHTDATYDEVHEIFMRQIEDRVAEFFNQVYIGIFEKAFLVQKSLEHDPSL